MTRRINPRVETFARLLLLLLAAFASAALGACRSVGVSEPRAASHARAAELPPRRLELTFLAPDDVRLQAVIDAPGSADVGEGVGEGVGKDVAGNATGGRWGVLLIGGGLGNDLDWTAPGSITVDGQTVQLTISGESHADAPALSAALVERGFVVMRWSTIDPADPLASEWPVRATPRSLSDLMLQSRLAKAALRRSGLVDPDRIILIGHSLGAARACTLASEEPHVKALVCLSPAYFTPQDATPRAFRDAGMKHGTDVVRRRSIPCLAIFGALDTSRAVDARGAQLLALHPELSQLSVHVLDGLGHQLGAQEGQLVGPLDAGVIDQIADWAENVRRDAAAVKVPRGGLEPPTSGL